MECWLYYQSNSLFLFLPGPASGSCLALWPCGWSQWSVTPFSGASMSSQTHFCLSRSTLFQGHRQDSTSHCGKELHVDWEGLEIVYQILTWTLVDSPPHSQSACMEMQSNFFCPEGSKCPQSPLSATGLQLHLMA